MGEAKEKKIWHTLLPVMLTTTAALFAASTTIFVNIRNDNRARELAIEAEQVRLQTERQQAIEQQQRALEAQAIGIHLDRVVVENDGSTVGKGDWRFVMEVDDQPLMSLFRDEMDDRAGYNVITLEPSQKIEASLDLLPNVPTAITVKGWRTRWLKGGGEPEVSGQGELLLGERGLSVTVEGEKPKRGQFVFYFSMVPKAS